MRRNFLASTALTASGTLVTGAVFAADMAVKAPPRPAPIPFSWTGCYIGGNAGGAWTQSDDSLTTAPFFSVVTVESSGHATSFTGGGQLGCNWQFNPSWVAGLEGDINYIHASRTQHGAIPGIFGPGSPAGAGEDTVRTISLRWLATVRGRFGYAWGQSFLYATGGLALGGVKSSSALTDADGIDASTIFAGSQSATRAGWTVGAGYEYAFNDRLSAKLEYLHFDLGTVQYSVPRVDVHAACCTPWTASANVRGDIVRLGVNYKFTQ
jgi:outer membrane immunogenic protein